MRYAVVLLILTLLVAGCGAPETIIIADEATCPECEIEFELIASLGGATEQRVPWLCFNASKLAVDSQGRFYASGCRGQWIYVFSKNGDPLEPIGGPGQGPGEFTGIRRIWVDSRDNLHVFEPRRHTILSPEREVIFSRAMPAWARDIVFREDGSTIQQLVSTTPALVGIPNHIVDVNGNIVQSFGAVDSTSRYATPSQASFRALADGGDGLIWSMHHVKYELELWDPEANRLVRTLKRDAGWFRRLKTETEGYLRGLRRDREGRLWTLAVMRDPAYEARPAGGRPGIEAPGAPPPLNWWRSRWDTWVEVIDPVAGTLVTATKWDRSSSYWVGDLIYNYRESEDGGVLIEVWRVRLVSQSQHAGVEP